MNDKILQNILAHDKVAKKYEKDHVEIYNEIEQTRLQKSLAEALLKIRTDQAERKALDFGCGAGNLTQYLLQMGLHVVAADVSKNFLNLVSWKYSQKYGDKFSTFKLNGEDLSGVESDKFDFIAMYSVLHHIPDYQGALRELIRVLKPGGVLYIDHEASPMVWSNSEAYREYSELLKREILQKTKLQRIRHILDITYWMDALKEFKNPRYKAEGDIHVFLDDHIEWSDIKKIFSENKMEIITESDYLLYTKHCPKNLYNQYKDKCNDIRLLVARKTG